MKKIIGLTVALIAVVALLASGTWAYFNDVQTVTGNTVTAGSLFLEPAGDSYSQPFTIPALKPLDDEVPANIKEKTITIKNSGTIDGYLNLDIPTYTNDENGIEAPEAAVGDVTNGIAGIGGGELGASIRVLVWFDMDSTIPTFGEGDSYIDSSGALITYDAITNNALPAYDDYYPLDLLKTPTLFKSYTGLTGPDFGEVGVGTLAAQKTAIMHIEYILPAATTKTVQVGNNWYYSDNNTQGDSASCNINFYLDQK